MEAELRSLIDQLASFPNWLADRACDIPASLTAWKPEGTEFSWVEQVCHLRDVEREAYYFRIARILEEEWPLFSDINGSKLAMERKYQAQNPTLALQTFRTFREANIARLRQVSPAEFDRRGTFGGAEGFPLSQAVGWMAAHDADHRGQIEALIVTGRKAGVIPVRRNSN
jgi:hypothetical protein